MKYKNNQPDAEYFGSTWLFLFGLKQFIARLLADIHSCLAR